MKLKQFVSNRERTLMRKIIQIVVCMGAMLSLQAGATSQDFDDAVSAYKSGRTDIAVQKFTSAAYAGDSVAQGLLGSMYLFGAPGVPENHREAVKWTRLAATTNHSSQERGLVESKSLIHSLCSLEISLLITEIELNLSGLNLSKEPMVDPWLACDVLAVASLAICSLRSLAIAAPFLPPLALFSLISSR